MINLNELKTRLLKPPRILILGAENVGKTTLACQFPNPIMLDLEQGVPESIDTVPTYCTKNYEGVVELLTTLIKEEHDFKTFIVDSLDVLEVLITNYVCAKNSWSSISQASWGAGYTARSTIWNSFIDALELMRNKGMSIVCIVHSAVTQVQDPILPVYDKHTIHLYKTEAQRFLEWSDLTAFAMVKAYTTNDGKRNIATTAGQRVIKTHSNPAYTAKTRYQMPDELSMSFDEISKYIGYYNTNTNDKAQKEEKKTTTKKEN